MRDGIVLALRVLGIERPALVGAPWFTPELNELGASYKLSRCGTSGSGRR
jgi:hypothetical protein